MTKRSDEVTVLGATGMLAVPVIRRWAAHGLTIRALVRDLDKARALLPDGVTLVQADLRDVESLRRGLEGTRHLYLNLSTDTVDPNLDFYAEHQGIANLLKAAEGQGVEHILQLSGLGAHPANPDPLGAAFVPNVVRKRGQALIRASGIPFTFFHASFFLDTLPKFVRNGAFTTIGTYRHPFFFTNSLDLADQVHRAMSNPDAMGRDFAVQGTESIAMEQAAARFLAIVAPGTPVRSVPLWIAQAMSWFMTDLRVLVAVSRYLTRAEAPLLAEDSWAVLGRPTFDLEAFFRASEDQKSAA